jgi:putative transposon-encoded protein
MNSDKKCNGSLIVEQVPFKRMLTRKVGANNETSGKISLPKGLIGKEVVVIVPEAAE